MVYTSSQYHNFMNSPGDVGGIVVPQEIYTDANSSYFTPMPAVEFPKGLYLAQAINEQYKDDPVYNDYPDTSREDRARFTMRLCVSICRCIMIAKGEITLL